MRLRVGTMRGGRYYSSLSHTEVCLLISLVCTLTGPQLVRAGSIPRFTQEPESQTVSHHSPVILRCSADPPTATLSWLFNGRPLDPARHRGLRVEGSNLHFPHFSHGAGEEANDGEYRCAASTEEGTVVSRPAILSKPMLRHFPPSDNITITVAEGGYVTLPCVAPDSRPPARVEIHTDSGVPLDTSRADVERLPSGSVILRRARVSDSGVYRCVAFNPASGHNRTAPHVIILKVTPRSQGGNQGQATVIVGQSTPELKAASNETVLLECPTAGTSTPANITWTRYARHHQLPLGSSQDQYGNLQIPAVKLHDGDTYFCQTPASQSLLISLEVRTLPIITQPLREKVVSVSVGERAEISCHGGAFPHPNVTWFFNGEVYGQRKISARTNVHSLVLERVTVENAGIYMCELSNVVGQAYGIIRLVVAPGIGGDGSAGSDLLPSENGLASNGTSSDTITIDEDDGSDVNNNRNPKPADVDGPRRRKNNRKRNKGKKKNRRRKNKRKKADKKVPPSVPTVTQLSDTSVMVIWNVRENDGLPITMFRIQFKEVKPNKGPWQTVDQEINKNARKHRVSRLKAGRSYKFRVAAVYDNHDHAFGPNSARVHLKVESYPELHPPKVKPKIVEVTPLIYQNNYALGIKWQYVPVDAFIKGFLIYYKPFDSEQDFEKVMLQGGGITKHTLADLMPDTDYSIKMQSYNSAGASEFSNTVVKRTKPLQGQTPRGIPTPIIPIDKDETEPTTSRREAGGLDQPVILGIVLGIMLLLLVVFIAMCWWKQRQQKRRNLHAEHTAKFQDQAQRIYAESLRKKHPNGGPYPLNGLNGLALANGHGPHGHHKLNIDVNPMSEIDIQRSHTPTLRDPYMAKAYHHGNGMIPNGTIPGYGHGHNSDNNFNSIRQTVSSDNVHGSSGMIPNGIAVSDMGSLSHISRNGGYNPQPYHPSSQSRSSVSSFTHDPHQRHRCGSLSQSDEGDSPDEEDPLQGERMRPSSREKTPTYSSFGHGYGKGHSHSHRERVNRSRDPSPDRMHCYGYGPAPSYDAVPGPGYGGVAMGDGVMEGSGFHMQVPVAAPSPASSSQSGKHKRRRKRPHSGREHTTKDQATNTDLSSNEGTIEFTMFNKSPSSSVSTGSDHSNSNSEGRTVTPFQLHSGVTIVTTPSHSVAMMTTSNTPLPVGPL